MYRIAMRLTRIVLLTVLAGCDRGSIFTTSDVPVYKPEAWWSDPEPLFWMRSAITEEGGGGLVLAHGPRVIPGAIPLYFYDPSAETFEQTPDEAWDEAGEPTVMCSGSSVRDTPFSLQGPGPARKELVFHGKVVPVAGGTAIRIAPAPTRNVVAVLSTDGVRATTSILFVANFDSTGQHYGQLFSEEDGSAIGSPVRLGLGGEGSSDKSICWSPDETLVIYSERGPHDGGPGKMCFVPVDE